MYSVKVRFDGESQHTWEWESFFGPFGQRIEAEECVLVLARNPAVRSAQIILSASDSMTQATET